MRKIVIGIIAFIFGCPAAISIGIHLYHLQFARFYQYATPEELETYLLEHVQIGKTTRVEAESFLQGLGINNCLYEASYNDLNQGSLKCDVLSPRSEYSNTIFHYLFVVDYYRISIRFKSEILNSLLVFDWTSLPLGGV